jgi:hypothetical protein
VKRRGTDYIREKTKSGFEVDGVRRSTRKRKRSGVCDGETKGEGGRLPVLGELELPFEVGCTRWRRMRKRKRRKEERAGRTVDVLVVVDDAGTNRVGTGTSEHAGRSAGKENEQGEVEMRGERETYASSVTNFFVMGSAEGPYEPIMLSSLSTVREGILGYQYSALQGEYEERRATTKRTGDTRSPNSLDVAKTCEGDHVSSKTTKDERSKRTNR